MSGYGSREVARMLGLTVAQVRAFVRDGFVKPERGDRGALRFSFQDLVLLRTAKGLVNAQIAPRRVKSALRKLRGQLPAGRELRSVHIHADGDRIVVGAGEAQFEAESGQVMFDFGTAELARKVEPLERSAENAGGWYERGCELEETEPARAREAYEKAVALEPGHADARVNLGRLLHEAGETSAAAEQYRQALAAHPINAVAAFNLGVALEDLRLWEESLLAYQQSLQLDPALADAHYNLFRIYEQRGQGAAALRHLRTYRKLVL